MAKYIISRLASYDLDDIADYTIETFGFIQADRYSDGLKRCFENLLEFKMRGRSAENLAPGLRALEYQSHTIFYQILQSDVLIVRILHQSQDPLRHL